MSDEGDMLVCPYNRSHVVSKLRMGRHLVKCQANHPNTHLATCFYDFLHRVPPAELDEHLETCPSKARFQVHFAMGEKSSDDSDGKVEKIFLTRNKLTLEKQDSGKTPDRKGYQGPAQSFTCADNESKKSIPKYSAVIGSQARSTPLSQSKMTSSAAPRKGFSAEPSFLMQYSVGNPKEPKGKVKQPSKPKEESWDSDSSEDTLDEQKQRSLQSSTTTWKDYDKESTHSGGNKSFKGDDFIDEDGFIKVHPRRRHMK